MAPSHQILCPDIISNVFENLAPGPKPTFDDFPAVYSEWSIRHYTLAASARACTLFTAPALDVLWREMSSVEPLFAILPTYYPAIASFTGIITEEQWQRFQVYALRVRRVSVFFRDRYRPRSIPTEQAWAVLLHRSQGSPVLPRLERLVIDGFFGGLAALLTPNLTHLDLNLESSSSHPDPPPTRSSADMYIAIVQPYLARIQSLSLHEIRPQPLVPGRINVFMLTHLRCLQLSNCVVINPPVMQSLMNFPNLRELRLDFQFSEDTQDALAASGLAPGFFELRELHLTASFVDIATFLDATDPVGLESLSLTRRGDFYSDYGTHMFHGMLDAYAKIPRRIHCLHLFLIVGGGHDYYVNQSTVPELSASRILPAALRTLPDLQELTVTYRGDVGGGVQDDDLLALSAAWPALRRFEFNCGIWGETGPSPVDADYANLPRFSTLLAFTDAHPHLVRLSLPALRAQDIPPPSARLSTPSGEGAARTGHGLGYFRLAAIPPRTPMIALALALDGAFPRLELGHPSRVTARTINRPAVGYEDQSRRKFSEVDVLMTLLLTLRTARGEGEIMI